MPTKLNIDTQIMKIVSYRYDFCTLLRCNHYKISCLKRLVVFLGSTRCQGGRRSKRRTGIELTARFFARTSEKWMWLDGGLNCSRRDSKAPSAAELLKTRLNGARRDSKAPGATQRRQRWNIVLLARYMKIRFHFFLTLMLIITSWFSYKGDAGEPGQQGLPGDPGLKVGV